MLLVLIDPPAPVKCVRNLAASGVMHNLLIHQPRRLGVIARAVVQPGCAPVRRRRVAAVREQLHQFGVVVDRLGCIVLQQVHVATGVQRLFQPSAGWEALDHLRDQRVMSRAVVLIARQLRQHIQLQRRGIVAGLGQLLDVARAHMFQLEVAHRRIDCQRVAIRRAQLWIVLADGVVLRARGRRSQHP